MVLAVKWSMYLLGLQLCLKTNKLMTTPVIPVRWLFTRKDTKYMKSNSNTVILPKIASANRTFPIASASH